MIGCAPCNYNGCEKCDGRGELFECRTCGLHFAASKLDSRDDCQGCVDARVAFKKRLNDEGSCAPPRRDV